MTNVFEVRFGQETRIGEDQLTIKSKPHSEERGLFGESYDRMSPLLGGQVFQRDGIRFGFVRRAINGDLEKKTSDAYDEILGCLGDTELYRCWNFVPQINVETEGTENYKLFNAGRRQAFDRHYGTDSTKRMSAATGIDIHGDDLIVLFIAGSDEPVHIRNPQQVSAYNYPHIYGKLPPSFARATRIADRYFISGTASIKGHETLYVGDVEKQVETMADNVEIMLSQYQMDCQKTGVVYVRRAEDIDLVRGLVQERFPEFSPVYLEANICRGDLLVEMEMTCFRP